MDGSRTPFEAPVSIEFIAGADEHYVKDHQKDSLTTDTCLCQKRLMKIYLDAPDSFQVSFTPAIKSKYGYFEEGYPLD
jgi:hypothetical protein